MSCDNLPHNGAVTRKALLAFATLRDADLHDWIKENVSFPNAMVDRITPMTSAAHRLQLADEKHIDDARQWSANRSCSGCWKTSSSMVARRGKKSACSSPMT